MNDLLSIIIPTFNEEENLDVLLSQLGSEKIKKLNLEVVVSDGNSSDASREVAIKYGAILVENSIARRSIQLNSGFRKCTGNVILFLHADSILPESFYDEILEFSRKGKFGCFRMRFDIDQSLLNFYAYFSRFRHTIFHGGDQGLFMSRQLFERSGGYNENYDLMEDYDLLRRIKKLGKFRVSQLIIITSAHKYAENGVLRLQLIYAVIHLMYFLGFSQDSLLKFYRSKVK